MTELPSVRNSPWRFRSWVLDLTSAVLAFFVAAFSGLKWVRDPLASRSEVVGIVAASLGILLTNGIKAWRTRRAELKFEPLTVPTALREAVAGLHARLCELRDCEPDALGVRIVIHKVHWDRFRMNPTEWEQITPYHGGVGGPLGRRMSARAGIVGRVARLAEPVSAKRHATDVQAFRTELIAVWGFTTQESHDISADRWAWLAFPLLQSDDRSTYGVVYLDAKDANLFDDTAIRDAVATACTIIASQCAGAYSRP